MNRIEMKNKLKKCLDILMSGTPQECKEAKKAIEKLWDAEAKNFQSAATIIFDCIPLFENIVDVKNQAFFISGLNLFYLSLADDHFDILKNFTLKVMQNSSGKVREAMRHVASWLSSSLSMRINPFVWPSETKLSRQEIQDQKIAKRQLMQFVDELESLIDQNETDDNKDFIYQMKPSVNKSMQMLWADVTDSPCYRRVLLEQNTVSKEIMSERMKIENKFKDLLRGKEKYFDFDDILEIIFNEEDSDDLMAIVQIFDNSDISKLSDVLELATDAWNYFPHRSLDGKSPAEMVEEHNEDIKYQMEKSGYYNDDGELIDPDDMLLPEKCLLCAKLHDPNEEILCNLNRIDQSGSNNFVCEAFDRRKL